MRTSDPTQEKDQALCDFMQGIGEKVIVRLLPLVDRGHAEEILQEAVFKVFLLAEKNPQSIPFLAKLQLLTPMVFTIAKNMAISEVRHNKVERRFVYNSVDNPPESNDATLEKSIISQHQSQMLHAAIENLPPVCRQVFIQCKLSGRSHSHIATMLGISTKTVESHLARGLKLCREYIHKHSKPGIKKVG